MGGSNGGGKLSLVARAGLEKSLGTYRESPVASFFMLETNPDTHPLAEITFCGQSRNVPSTVANSNLVECYSELVSDKFENAIFSGGSSIEQYEAESKAIGTRWTKRHSLFPQLGTLGAASVAGNIFESLNLIKNQSLDSVDCLNRDVYGRESMISVRRVQ